MAKSNEIEPTPAWIKSSLRYISDRNPHKVRVSFLLAALERTPDAAKKQTLAPAVTIDKGSDDVYLTWASEGNSLVVRFDDQISYAKGFTRHADVPEWTVIEADLVSCFRELISWVIPKKELL